MRTLVVSGDDAGGGVIDRTSDVGKSACFGRVGMLEGSWKLGSCTSADYLANFELFWL